MTTLGIFCARSTEVTLSTINLAPSLLFGTETNCVYCVGSHKIASIILAANINANEKLVHKIHLLSWGIFDQQAFSYHDTVASATSHYQNTLRGTPMRNPYCL